MKGKQIPMTPGGRRRLVEELKRLKAVERPRIVAEIETARGHGDLSENAEYEAAKEKQALLTKKMAEIEDSLARAQVIDPAQISHGRVAFGARIRLKDGEGVEVRYQIVGAAEADVRENKISIESPIARFLLGKQEGDLVEVVTPGGRRELEILEIRYESSGDTLRF